MKNPALARTPIPPLAGTTDRLLSWRADTGLGIAMVLVLGVMLLPMPAALLDLLLSLSVSLSLVVFLFALYIERPLEFSAFPSVLLLTTLLRLSLNVASTRLILLHGNQGADAAGQVIQAFAQFVIGGNTFVGLIIFLILVVINFAVITKGAGRIAEVAARFTLDSMPGKQMAIDADLTAGLCTDEEGRRRRRQLEQEADFFGAMDGAGKFVRGDAVAGLMITGVNIVGGLIIGVAQQHMPIVGALKTYTGLTVGDGLVTQIPALMTSIAAGLVTTRAATGGSLGVAVSQQLFGTRRPLYIAAGVLTCLSVIPGMPHVAFFVLGALLGFIAYTLPDPNAPGAGTTAATPLTPQAERADVEALLPIELLEVELGYELVPLVDTDKDGTLMVRIAGIRKQIAQDLGIIVPPIHMRDNLRLRPSEYRVKLSGSVIGQGELRTGKMLAINPGNVVSNIPGEAVIEPAFRLPALWILPADRQRAEVSGYTVVDAATVAGTHIGELIAAHAFELIGRREVQELLDVHGRSLGKVIEELIPTVLSAASLIKVLRNLLRERLSIRDFRSILEALADAAADTKDTDQLTEMVRQRLSKQLTAKYVSGDGTVRGLALAPHVEAAFRRMQGSAATGMDPAELQRLAQAFELGAREVRGVDMPVILTAADVRRNVATFAARYMPGMPVLSFRELDTKATVQTIGLIGGVQGVTRHAI